jgi:hypothetical protein
MFVIYLLPSVRRRQFGGSSPAAHAARAAASEAEVFTIGPELKQDHQFCEVVGIECKLGRL